ncbi:MAG: hypothetical protein ACI9XO_003248 [Paraglaciecola sp.]|jgi:hypothetical protein
MQRIFLIFTCWIISQTSFSQTDFSGVWTGVVTQENKAIGFFYQLNLTQDGAEVKGTSYSKTEDESKTGEFAVAGVVENNELILQEVNQLKPKDEKWCMKNLRLKLSDNQASVWVGGAWTATGCSPGKVRLERKRKGDFSTDGVSKEEAIFGSWAGSLSQSDREYGFYFEMNLATNDIGTSYIVAEGNGGSCTHDMTWILIGNSFNFSENEIVRKEKPKWKWCIKSGSLTFREEANKYVMEGKWEGYIEGFTMETGACASGNLYLEKPIIRSREEFQKMDISMYEVKQNREVKVARMLEVHSPNLKIKVWDNGIVDGDVLSLFLNGEMLFDNHRVTKNKRGINVELKEDINLLILHAEDLGDIKPNTVAVSIHDGVKEQILILSSNLRESGAVMIKQFKMKE